jgi:hypothetical protein
MNGEGDAPQATVLRDRGLVVAGWVIGIGCVIGAIAAGVAGSVSGVVVLGAIGAWFVGSRLNDVPRVELHDDRVVIRSFTTTEVPYDEIVGTRIDTRWWAGRSALVLERGYGHETWVPAGLGLGPPRWQLELRDELNRRSPKDFL